jgi:hypothetical protein
MISKSYLNRIDLVLDINLYVGFGLGIFIECFGFGLYTFTEYSFNLDLLLWLLGICFFYCLFVMIWWHIIYSVNYY